MFFVLALICKKLKLASFHIWDSGDYLQGLDDVASSKDLMGNDKFEWFSRWKIWS